MKQSQPSKRTLVIVEKRKLLLDFCFHAPGDGQKIKKMRMLDTTAETETLTHNISTNNTLDKVNLTINHRDSQADTSSKKQMPPRVKEGKADAKSSDEMDAADSDIEVDIEKVHGEEGQQLKYTSRAKIDFAQLTATIQFASDHLEENGKNKESTSPDFSKIEQLMPKDQPDSISTPTQEASTITSFTEHYASAHNIIIPSTAKYPHLQPDPNNIDLYCQMCVRTFKTQITFLQHLRLLHKIRHPYKASVRTSVELKDSTVLENLSNKMLDSKSTTVSSKSPNVTPSLTSASSDQNSAMPLAPTDPEAVKRDTNSPAIQVSKIGSNNSSTSSMAQFETMLTSAIQNAANDLAIGLFINNGLMNRIPTSPSPSSSSPPKQNQSPAKAPSTVVAPEPTMQGSLVAPYPDLLDPHNYCRCCDTTFANPVDYRKHCRTQHTIPLPDRNDPNFFCYVCNLKSPDLFTYRKHLAQIHQMKGFPDMFDIKCYHCSRTFAVGKRYSAHLVKVAKKEQKLQLMENRPPPMWDDPSFHCSRCLKTFKDDTGYKKHLRRMHGMRGKDSYKISQDAQEKSNHSNEVVEGEDEDKDHYFCFACQKDYFDKQEFDQHLKEAHRLNLTKASVDNLKIAPSPPVFAKPLDPTLYYFMMRDIGQVKSN
ncbi:hypothetical protein MAM1_0244c08624 [Mucor ambiguus]|uniref:C2H2-type domain-containing protein n=1 Tax=Mucor ambiguus TaxID=91626 RepID=A0A0C9MZL9_9FUNG|nr:hypothetical protein MAM1_0244c08624 [Mucor ambiguus]